MAIKLKTGSGAPLPTDLIEGEPALDLTNKRLYSETGGVVFEVGTNPSELTLAGTLVTATGTELNILDGITAFLDDDSMAANSATALASQQSIKQYVDVQVGAAPSGTASYANFEVTLSLTIPSGTTAARPSTPSSGNIRYNTSLTAFEGYDGSDWKPFGATAAKLHFLGGM
jgi:hypothetical protein